MAVAFVVIADERTAPDAPFTSQLFRESIGNLEGSFVGLAPFDLSDRARVALSVPTGGGDRWIVGNTVIDNSVQSAQTWQLIGAVRIQRKGTGRIKIVCSATGVPADWYQVKVFKNGAEIYGSANLTAGLDTTIDVAMTESSADIFELKMYSNANPAETVTGYMHIESADEVGAILATN